ncbi:phage baseplate protein [Anaerovoracaceae bacterium Sow4_D4]
MAVKGSATVTLSQYRDTESVTRYYKLQSSSLAAPDKPANVKPNEPPAGWSKSEPACDITKTLYTCDVTVFSDKTTHVSDVSKSTSYEAAKEAWNKAQTAKNTATEAAKTADNYISADSTGIMVSENKGATKETPSNATKNNVLITEKDVQIRNGQEVVASYGKSAIIGKNKSNNIQIKDNGFSINHDGNEMFVVKQEDEENNYINEIMEATYEASTDTYSLESSYKAYYPNKRPILYVIYRSKPYGIVSRKETIQYGDTKLPCTVSITEEGKYLVQFKKTDWDKSWRDMDPEIEMDYYAVGGGAMVTIGTRIDYGLENSGSWSLTVGSANTAGSRSIAVGENNVARDNSATIGSMCYAKNDAIAVGSYAKATSYRSVAIGDHVSTDQMNQLVVGQYNRQTPYGTQFVVGCGGDSETANAAAITASGDIRLKGTVYIGCKKDSTGGKSIIDLIYPVGSIYMSVNSADPGTLFGGTWERIKDRFLLSAGDTYAAGNTGGSAKATLPSHTHTFGSNGYDLWVAKRGKGSTEPGNQISGDAKYYAAATGGSTANYKWLSSVDSKGVSDVSQANMPPYLAVYVWQRIN